MSDNSEAKRRTILYAAIDVFAKYGFRRCSMEDIAAAADMSRPALYQYFRNKTEIFRAGSDALQRDAVAAAKKAAVDPTPRPFADRLFRMLLAYKAPAWRVTAETPHGRDMIDLNAALAEDLTEAAMAEAWAVFAEAIRREAAPGWDATEAARILTTAAWSVVQQSASKEAFEADLRGLARIWANALTRPPVGEAE